jgi:cobalt-zinc-cadmium efflux system outer membrane protein
MHVLLSVVSASRRGKGRGRTGALLLLVGQVACPAAAEMWMADVAPLTVQEAVRIGIERSPAVTAAESRLQGATAAVRGARAPYNPVLETAPGVGFTNGNALLSQRLDLTGKRSAEGRVAAGERAAAVADLAGARLRVAGEVRLAYYDLARARAVEAAATESHDLTRSLLSAVRRRIEIGEAPAVQAIRAEIEVARAEQEQTRARGDAASRAKALNRLLGYPLDSPLMLSEGLEVPAPPPAAAQLVETALDQRPEVSAARSLVEAQRGHVEVARSLRRPDLFAELASEVWSLDRDPFRSRNLGFQLRLSMPLFDRGRIRTSVEGARAGVREREAEVEQVRRTLALEVERAAADLATAREVALNYQRTILPRSQELLKSIRSGFDLGLTSFLEVLEAQRVVRQTQTEYLDSLYEALRAQINLDRALGIAPGVSQAPPSPARGGR